MKMERVCSSEMVDVYIGPLYGLSLPLKLKPITVKSYLFARMHSAL
jgi:hypothetical protein